MIGKPKFETYELVIVILTTIVGTAIKKLDANVGLIFDLWQFIATPSIFIRKEFKKKWWIVIVANVLLFVFQAISMITKNLGFGFITITNSLVVGLIYSIDITIMLILYYLYSVLTNIKKEK